MTKSEVLRASENVAAAYDEAVAAYAAGLKREAVTKAANAAQGETVTIGKRITDEGIAQDVIASIGAAREKAMSEITRGLERVSKKLSEPPSDEGARYIVSIQGRDDLSADEITAALSRYPEHATQHAIRAAAQRSGVKVYAGKTEAEREADAYRALSGKVGEYFSLYAIEGGQGARNTIARRSILSIGNGAEPGSFAELEAAFTAK